jgi:hypothetical protein
MTFDRTTAPIYAIQAVLALIVVSPTIAGFAARVALAAPYRVPYQPHFQRAHFQMWANFILPAISSPKCHGASLHQ